MKIFTSDQIKDIDRYTIDNEPVTSSDLMERAAGRLYSWISQRFGRSTSFLILTGPGNNGGDGLALARIMKSGGYDPSVFNIKISSGQSDDWKLNRRRLDEAGNIKFSDVNSTDDLPLVSGDSVIVDAIFGTGLKRRAEGLAADVIGWINRQEAYKISVDLPSGLFGEDNVVSPDASIVMADVTLVFQFPRLSFMFPETFRYTGEWHILPIGLHPEAVNNTLTPYHFLQESDIAQMIRKRGKFDHKGNFGHGLLVAGSRGKTGAAILGAGGALRAGIGLITCHLPSSCVPAMQASLPEAMVQYDDDPDFVTGIALQQDYNSIAAGPGIGTGAKTAGALKELLKGCGKPLLLDADALNILGANKKWLELLPAMTILTPHPKEFERIAGPSVNSYDRLLRQRAFSKDLNCVIVLKGAHTSVSLPDGGVYFNSTGNPGMATAGSGDVLTGILLSLLAQGYSPGQAAIAGVYLHGLAGDIASETGSYESLIASDIIRNIGKAFRKVRESKL